MFKKVLIAEDHESISISVRKTLEDLNITVRDYSYYCDDALLAVKNALADGSPYELLITDLSFDADDRTQKIIDGEELITAVKQVQPGLKTLVFSAEQKASVIDPLFNNLGVNGFVRKARRDAEELKSAIADIYKNKQHYPTHLGPVLQQKNAHDFTNFDITIIGLLAGGKLQKDIPAYLAERQIKPASLSSLEKRLNLIREAYGFSNNEQLVVFCKEMGLI